MKLFVQVLIVLMVFLFAGKSTVSAQDACMSDINIDGIVDLRDYSLLVRNFFSSSPDPVSADVNTDGIVDLRDYSILVQEFFKSCIPELPDEITQTETDIIFYVDGDHSQASDTNDPTNPDTPLATIAEAVSQAKDKLREGVSVTVLIDPGVYREEVNQYLGANTDPLLVIKAEGGKAVIKGSDVWSEWTKESGTNDVYVADWQFDWGYEEPPSGWPDTLDTGNEIAGRSELVAVNDTLLMPVLSHSELTAGTFYVDEVANKLYIKPDASIPDITEATVEVAVRTYGMRLQTTSNLVVQNISVQHVAKSVWGGAAFYILSTDGGIFENIESSDNGGSGVGKYTVTNSSFRNITARNNGASGLGGTRFDNVSFTNIIANDNNWRGHRAGFTGWSVAGIKHLYVHNATYENVEVSGNKTHGYWCDTNCTNVTMTNVRTTENLRYGMYLEANNGPITITDAVFANNDNEPGLNLSNSEGVTIQDSIFYDNGERGSIMFTGRSEGRTNDDWQTGVTYTAHQRDFTLRNSAIVSRGDRFLVGTTYHVDYWGPYVRDTLISENNVWYNPDRTDAFNTYHNLREDFTGWQAESTQDLSSVFEDPQFPDPENNVFE